MRRTIPRGEDGDFTPVKCVSTQEEEEEEVEPRLQGRVKIPRCNGCHSFHMFEPFLNVSPGITLGCWIE
ncbi:hypothetical protein EYF80_025292 [Liparis tanakae]|uniref:Uncharacterized protein n=1 Tax=Liparis tanakae TaxID=230148 RepID=A0A4Z2HI09_9TELE|nr:hypothetical protein EYF80_025292 [Liparis tanakae]